jgi:hypothetical protein
MLFQKFFCNWLFNLENKVQFKILFIRLFLGLTVGIGTVVLMNYFILDKTIVMEGYGILLAAIDFNVLLYVPIMKSKVPFIKE